MAKAKRTVAKVEKKIEQKHESRFPNFLLALTFLIIVGLLLSLFFKNSPNRLTLQNLSNLFTRSNSVSQGAVSVTPTPEKDHGTPGEDYVVKQGDHLWKIAEEAYGSGYNAYDIAKANNLQNPSTIEIGQRLKMPDVAAKTPTKGEVAGNGETTVTPPQASQSTPVALANKPEYIVQNGDCLWNIAVQKYGDGFMWTKIAQANNLRNPRVIHSGNKLILPS